MKKMKFEKFLRFEPVKNQIGLNRTILSKIQSYNSLYFLQFIDQIGHEETENHVLEALRIIMKAILALF